MPNLRTIQTALLAWFAVNGRDLPWRRTRDPYQILVAEIMLQQTQVERVKPKYAAFLAQFPSLQALAAASPGDVIRAWAGLGYNRRALNLQRTAQVVLSDHNGLFPDTPEALITLPGIGPYTAGAVACFAFERDVAFMDTNIRRVVRRVFAGPDEQIPAPSDKQLLAYAHAAVPSNNGWAWNQAIMELGALICTAARPACPRCPLRQACQAYAAWQTADEQLILMPQTPKMAHAVREKPAPFHTTNRYFRGRVVAVLRDLAAEAVLPLNVLGPRIKNEWRAEDEPWLIQLVWGLAEDGLVVETDDGVRLP